MDLAKDLRQPRFRKENGDDLRSGHRYDEHQLWVTPSPLKAQYKRELTALGTTILVVLLAPLWLAYKGCEKYHEWQQDRTYAFQRRC